MSFRRSRNVTRQPGRATPLLLRTDNSTQLAIPTYGVLQLEASMTAKNREPAYYYYLSNLLLFSKIHSLAGCGAV